MELMEKHDLTGWKKILTWGSSVDVLGKGSARILVNNASGEVIGKYNINKDAKARAGLNEDRQPVY